MKYSVFKLWWAFPHSPVPMWEKEWHKLATGGRYRKQRILLAEISAWAVSLPWKLSEFTWLWMYLVCSPWSSSPCPSTSSLYWGLMTTMMRTDFCKMLSCCQLLQKTTFGVTLCSIVRLTSFKYLSIHLVMPIARTVLWNMSICQKQAECEHLYWVAEKFRLWRNSKTYNWFESLITQKFGERNNFSGCVHWICDENIPCHETDTFLSARNKLYMHTVYLRRDTDETYYTPQGDW